MIQRLWLVLMLFSLALPMLSHAEDCSVVSVSWRSEEVSWTLQRVPHAWPLPADGASGPALVWRVLKRGEWIDANNRSSVSGDGLKVVKLVAHLPLMNSHQDRVYPTAIRFADGSFALLSSSFVEPASDNNDACVRYIAEPGTYVSGFGKVDAVEIDTDRTAPTGYVVFARQRYPAPTGIPIILDAGLPSWTQAEMVQDAKAVLERYRDAMGVHPVPMIIGYAAPSATSSAYFWGDHLPGSVTLGLYGDWSKNALELQRKIQGFLDHELFHIWNASMVNRNDPSALLALEGGAEFSRLLLENERDHGDTLTLLDQVSHALNHCTMALGSEQSLSAALNSASPGRVPYDCGIVYMFLLFADSTSDPRAIYTEYLTRWAHVIHQDSNKFYSWSDLLKTSDSLLVKDLDDALHSSNLLAALTASFHKRGFVLKDKQRLEPDEKMALGFRVMWDVMALDCHNQVGFTTTEHGYQLDDALPACQSLRAGKTVTSIAGISLLQDPVRAYSKIMDACVSHKPVAVGYAQADIVTKITCSTSLPKLMMPVSIVNENETMVLGRP